MAEVGFPIDDFLQDSAGMDPLLVGPCLRLWRQACTPIARGTLPDDDAQLRRWTGLGAQFDQHRSELLACFKTNADGRLAHPLLVHLFSEAARKTESARTAALAKHRKKNQAPEPARSVDLFAQKAGAPPPAQRPLCNRTAPAGTTVPNDGILKDQLLVPGGMGDSAEKPAYLDDFKVAYRVLRLYGWTLEEAEAAIAFAKNIVPPINDRGIQKFVASAMYIGRRTDIRMKVPYLRRSRQLPADSDIQRAGEAIETMRDQMAKERQESMRIGDPR